MRIAVTSRPKPSAAQEARARGFADELGASYLPRRGDTLSRLLAGSGIDRLLVAADDKLKLIDAAANQEYFFHPNMALVRGLNIMRGARDLFAEATGLGPGDSILDCTVGFAAEATLASFLVGPTGLVVGLESVPELALVTREGVASFHLQTKVLCEALRRVRIVNADYREYLLKADDKSFDVVYFDPFFEDRLSGSENSVSPLFLFGNTTPLDADAVQLARAVARRRVVIKHPKQEELPPSVEEMVTSVVTTRKNRIAYSVIEADA
jgi:16S rRNA (guanine1516-N2)-methyltransferase